MSFLLWFTLLSKVLCTDLSLYDRDLVVNKVTSKQILDNHLIFSNLTQHENSFDGITLAYVTPWNNRGYDIAKWFKGKFTHIAPVWFTVKPERDSYSITGGHDADPEWIHDIRSNGGAKVTPRFRLDGFGESDFRKLLEEHAQAKTLVNLIVNEIEKHSLDGCVIESSLSPKFLHGFFDLLHQKLHSKPNRYLFLAIFPKHTYYKQEFITADEIKLLEPLVDGFSLMTYDYSRDAGPNAPIDWIEDNVKHLDPKGLFRAKILIGLNMYGYGYIGDEGSVITGSQYLQIVERYDPEFEWDDDAQEHEFTYKGGGISVRVFYPTLKSIDDRIALAEELKCGISIWEIGQGLDYFYELL